MVALQSFAAANTRLDGITARVATGLKVAGPVDDAADFGIAQGIRSTINAWKTVAATLGGAQGVLGVTLAATTQISNILGDLKKQVIEYFAATDPNAQTALQNAIDQSLANIDLAANSATYNGANLITTNEPAPVIPAAPPDQGTTFTFNGSGSNVHALGTSAGTLIVSFSKVGGAARTGTFELDYNGTAVASTTVSNANRSGSLTFAYPAAPATDIAVKLTQIGGGGGFRVRYSFVLNFPPPSNTSQGSFQVTSDPQGNFISVQHRSMLAADLGLTSAGLTSDVGGALAQLDLTQQLVDANLGYYASAATQVRSAVDTAQRFQDALTIGLGSLVDANLGQESAALVASRVRQSLAVQSLSIANAAPNVLLGLLRQ